MASRPVAQQAVSALSTASSQLKLPVLSQEPLQAARVVQQVVSAVFSAAPAARRAVLAVSMLCLVVLLAQLTVTTSRRMRSVSLIRFLVPSVARLAESRPVVPRAVLVR